MVGGQAYVMDGDIWQGWRHVVGCGGMWQGVGACGRGGGRVWGHMAGVGVCGRGSGLWHGWGHVAGEDTYGRVWGHVAGCGGMWQGVGVVVWGQDYGIDGDMWQGWGIW